MGLSEEGGLLRMLKSQGAVRDSLISGHGQSQPHPPLTPLLCSGSMQGQRTIAFVWKPNPSTDPSQFFIFFKKSLSPEHIPAPLPFLSWRELPPRHQCCVESAGPVLRVGL